MIWNSGKTRKARRHDATPRNRVSVSPQRLESRLLLAADPIHVGLVYLETDYLESDNDTGSDSRGDRFLLSFQGGAEGTELTELRISTDKDSDGLSVGDSIFDTQPGGRGKSGSHDFQVVQIISNGDHQPSVQASVDDGGQELVLQLSNFRNGDRLEFTLDVDEVLRNSADLAIFNDRLDVITSGQEFQDSILEAVFEAPHFHSANADAVFVNDFGDPADRFALDLPPDEGNDVDSRPNRSAAAIGTTVQQPLPVSISGTVWLDSDMDEVREPGEPGIANVVLDLYELTSNGTYASTGFQTQTDQLGRYEFGESFGLLPGTYQVVETQPVGYFSLAAVPGSVQGNPTGESSGTDVLTGIEIPLGDTQAVEMDFAELTPASISGQVYLLAPGTDCDGPYDPSSDTPLADVLVSLWQDDELIATTTSDSSGGYRFDGLMPGTYRVTQQTPPELLEGDAHVGEVNGVEIGVAAGGSEIRHLTLTSGAVGVNYDFCEAAPVSISGAVFHDRNDDGNRQSGEEPIADVLISLHDENGTQISTTTTDSLGQYRFDQLSAGNYQVRQQQPVAYLDGKESLGSVNGSPTGTVGQDQFTSIVIAQGLAAVNYDFGELLPGSISGMVHADLDRDCVFDPGEMALSGVMIRLLDETGTQVAEVETNDEGIYRFEGLSPGRYTVVQDQPSGYYDRSATPGSLGGVRGVNQINQIDIESGQESLNYDFCEEPGVTVAGAVYLDLDQDCIWEQGEPAIAGVTIELHDDNGLVATSMTDQSGHYLFDNLPAGSYTLIEVQPEGYLDGCAELGSEGGLVLDANTVQVSLSPGAEGTDYVFSEVQAVSIQGQVWSDNNNDRVRDQEEFGIEGVTVELRDENQQVLQSTLTDSQGVYRFESLTPGTYGVTELQPSGYFHSGQLIGTSGGQVTQDDTITFIVLNSGDHAVGYDFPELPSAMISGFVFQDGPTIESEEELAFSDLLDRRDGLRSEDDAPIAGVRIELRHADGRSLSDEDLLAGANESTVTFTDDAGYYQFVGLRPGDYMLLQTHPDDYLDFLETSGTTGGLSDNVVHSYTSAELLRLDAVPIEYDGDAIVGVMVAAGETSTENNFSEVQVVVTPPPPVTILEPEPTRPPRLLGPVYQDIPRTPLLYSALIPDEIQPPAIYGGEQYVVWHLSVINGGFPRGGQQAGSAFRVVSTGQGDIGNRRPDFDAPHDLGQWSFLSSDTDVIEQASAFTLGDEFAIARSGDFDGDGSDEVLIYVGGVWYIDVNGNGFWDSSDLWVVLGTTYDVPVVGDWDGDGKDDVGIYGARWDGDELRIRMDAGLPDPANQYRRKIENRFQHQLIAAEETDANGQVVRQNKRVLQRSDQGDLRTDAVDHVFRFGQAADIPVVGDWNGDGVDQIGVFNNGSWMLDLEGDGRQLQGERAFEYGQAGDRPVVGDFDGDGLDDIAIVRGGQIIIDSDGDRRLTAADQRIEIPPEHVDSQLVIGDWDGDGDDEIAFYKDAG